MCSPLQLLNFNKVDLPITLFVNLNKVKNLTKLAPLISPTGLIAKKVIEQFDKQILPFKDLPISLILVLQKQDKTAFSAKIKTLSLNSFSIFNFLSFLDCYKFYLINRIYNKTFWYTYRSSFLSFTSPQIKINALY